MSCFWKANIASLGGNLLKQVLKCKNTPHPKDFVVLLKTNAIETCDVLWNDQELREQELTEKEALHIVEQSRKWGFSVTLISNEKQEREAIKVLEEKTKEKVESSTPKVNVRNTEPKLKTKNTPTGASSSTVAK